MELIHFDIEVHKIFTSNNILHDKQTAIKKKVLVMIVPHHISTYSTDKSPSAAS